MRWEISKSFRFEAGHRVWKQNLSSGRGAHFASGSVPQNKCVNLHGHSYLLEVVVGSDSLSDQDMVMDFYHIKSALRDLIEEIDHSFIIDESDPLFPHLRELSERFGNLKLFPVSFCPTAEALARFFYDFLTEKLKEANLLGEVRVVRVTLWETATSRADYRGEDS